MCVHARKARRTLPCASAAPSARTSTRLRSAAARSSLGVAASGAAGAGPSASKNHRTSSSMGNSASRDDAAATVGDGGRGGGCGCGCGGRVGGSGTAMRASVASQSAAASFRYREPIAQPSALCGRAACQGCGRTAHGAERTTPLDAPRRGAQRRARSAHCRRSPRYGSSLLAVATATCRTPTAAAAATATTAGAHSVSESGSWTRSSQTLSADRSTSNGSARSRQGVTDDSRGCSLCAFACARVHLACRRCGRRPRRAAWLPWRVPAEIATTLNTESGLFA
jgi:hypothetical protein